MKRRWIGFVLFVVCFGMYAIPVVRAEGDLFERAPWSLSLGGGAILYEGDEEVENGGFLQLKLGYDLSPRWTVEADFNWMPNLKAREFKNSERTKLDGDTWAMRLEVDLLFHLRHVVENMHWDPYITGGAGMIYYGDELNSGKEDFMFCGGAGLFYHFNDEWALRMDGRGVIAGTDTEVNWLLSGGINWRWGASLPVVYEVQGGEIDSDGDGLFDAFEVELGTDPYDPDTDDDGLLDGEEVNDRHTDPLNPDTDWDALKDGAEVFTYNTDPLEPDTDNGGVMDGHEVIEDHTDPLNPADDLQLYTLNIEFDYDKADIRPEYYDELDMIVKVLRRDPGSTARIEGHADKRKTSKRAYNIRLSERRAKAVMNYMVDVGGIDPARLTFKGYGFDRPIAPNDTEINMQKNRRTEIYISPSGQTGMGDEEMVEEIYIIEDDVAISPEGMEEAPVK